MDSFLVIGGDMRFAYLAELLAEKNEVYALGFGDVIPAGGAVRVCSDIGELPSRADYMILPLPVLKEDTYINTPLCSACYTLEAVAAKSPKMALTGMADSKVLEVFQKNCVPVIDYFNREELAIFNSVPTAEGAVQIAMEELPVTICGTNCLITGYGRITKSLVKILSGMGAGITIAARKHSDLAWAEVQGAKAVHISKLADAAGECELIINTVPVRLFGEETLTKVKKDCLIIDLASKPGGVDFNIAKNLGLRVIWALSLPGKVAPITSGKIIYNTINNIIEEL